MSAGSQGPTPVGARRPCELTILLPCLDEAETVGVCVGKARGYLERTGVDGEVLVADNGSRDGSPGIARQAGARVIAVERRGYGHALAAGTAAAAGRFVIMGDADDSYDFAALDPFLERLRGGADLVIGNRFQGGIAPGAMPALHRYVGNPLLSAIGRLFYRSPVGDFHCGLRGVRRDALLGLGLMSGGMEYASEMIVRATVQGLRIEEVATTLTPAGRTRPPHLRSFRDGWRHLRFLLLFSPRWLFLYPGLLLMIAGLASMLWLLPAPRRVGRIELDVNTLVFSAAAIVCGFQAMVFAVLSKVFAMNAGLLPEDRRVRRLTSVVTVESGTIAGVLLVLGGLTGGVYAVGLWGRAAFGPLDPQVTLRVVAPSATALILGLQMIFASFFLAVLGFGRR
jgi:glycosyltransferase involved in cell wall biosynthesis